MSDKRRLIRQLWTVALIALAVSLCTAQFVATPVFARPATFGDAPEFVFEGYIKAQSPTKWLIGNTLVLVDGSTQFSFKDGPAEVGAWTKVWATSNAAGALHADLIVVLRRPGQLGLSVQFAGELHKQAGDLWVVGDMLIRIASDTHLPVIPPTLHCLLWVEGVVEGDLVRARTVEVIASEPVEVPTEFEGTIAGIQGDKWRVDETSVTVPPRVIQNGPAAVGQHVEIRAVRQSDGTLIASLARMVKEPEEAKVTAIVASIVEDKSGTQIWDLIVFSDELWANPEPVTMYVDGNTLLDESRAVAKPDQWVDITALPLSGGQYRAQVVRVEQPVPVTVSGKIDRAPKKLTESGWWEIDGRPVWAPKAGIAVGNLDRDSEASVEGVLLGNGVVWAKQIQEPKATSR